MVRLTAARLAMASTVAAAHRPRQLRGGAHHGDPHPRCGSPGAPAAPFGVRCHPVYHHLWTQCPVYCSSAVQPSPTGTAMKGLGQASADAIAPLRIRDSHNPGGRRGHRLHPRRVPPHRLNRPTRQSRCRARRSQRRRAGSADYRRLLIEPGDINTGTDTFATRSLTTNPGGSDGVSALFVNQHDTRAIGDTILILPDSAAAMTTLNTTVSSIGTIVTGGRPQPSPVGTGGTVVSGTSPDGSKAVTVLLFTEGRAVVRLEFGSAPGDPMPPQVVTDVGKKQEIAIRTELPG